MYTPFCCIVDEDLKAADELAVLLEKIDQAGHISIAENIPQAMDILLKIKTDLLFIRIVAWDEYRIVAPLLPAGPGQVVFLSGRRENSTANLSLEVDFRSGWNECPGECWWPVGRIHPNL